MIVQVNNYGVASLEKGDLREAFIHFRHALSLVASVERDPGVYKDNRNAPRELNPTDSIFDFTCTAQSSMCLTESYNEVYVHKQAFRLVDNIQAYSQNEEVCMAIVSSMVLYNLALVFHLRSLSRESSSNSEALMTNATAMYGKSVSILVNKVCHVSTATGNPVLDTLFLALFNNMGHTRHMSGGNLEEAKRCYETLVTFAHSVTAEAYDNTQGIGMFMIQLKTNLTVNAIILLTPMIAAAA